MKKIIAFLFIFTISFTCFAQSKPELTQRTSSLSTLQQAKSLIKELNDELILAKNNSNSLKNKLTSAETNLNTANTQIETLQKEVTILRNWGIEQQKSAFEWMEKHDKMQKRYHFLKNLTGIIAAIYGFTFGIWCMRYVPPIYAAYAFALPIVTAIIAFFAVWLVL
jgi:septal ring factor EnvC (AmiA/AmiB activator)